MRSDAHLERATAIEFTGAVWTVIITGSVWPARRSAAPDPASAHSDEGPCRARRFDDDPAFLRSLHDNAWPGNIRELRNFLERYLVFEELAITDTRELAVADTADGDSHIPVDVSLPFSEARQAVLNEFERIYIVHLLELYDGKVSRAASEAGIDRTYIYKLVRRHELDK